MRAVVLLLLLAMNAFVLFVSIKTGDDTQNVVNVALFAWLLGFEVATFAHRKLT